MKLPSNIRCYGGDRFALQKPGAHHARLRRSSLFDLSQQKGHALVGNLLLRLGYRGQPRYRVLPQLDAVALALDAQLQPAGPHGVPMELMDRLHAHFGA